MLSSLFKIKKKKTGLFTSPHIHDFRERIRVNDNLISEQSVIDFCNEIYQKNWTIQPSFFEITWALALRHFIEEQCEICIIETGLGGRLDSTNIISPLISLITNISYDHIPLLGTTMEQIAGEKAGIIKPGIPVVISQFQPEVAGIFRERADLAGAPLFFASQEYHASYSMTGIDGKQIFNFRHHDKVCYKNLKTDLSGLYQRLNIPAVLKSVDILRESGWKIPDKAVYQGLAQVTTLTGLQGRWQVIGHNPLIVCDTGHNEDGIREVVLQIRQTPYKKLHFVVGVVADKDISKVLALLPGEAVYYFTQANIPRALEAVLLREQAEKYGLKGEIYSSVREAFSAAQAAAQKDDLVFIGGSNFVVAEIL